jgi:hypothetical protein
MDAAPEPLAVRPSPSVASASKRAPAAQAKDARKSDAVEAEQESQDAVAGSVALGATADEAGGRPAHPGRALAKRLGAEPALASQQELDALARSVDQRRRAGELAESVKGPCRRLGEVERRVYRDQEGRIVAYLRRELTGDGQVTAEHYYDEAGRLRMAELTRIQSGRRTVERIYLDATGERRLSGARAPAGLVRDPEEAFRSAAPCADGQ